MSGHISLRRAVAKAGFVIRQCFFKESILAMLAQVFLLALSVVCSVANPVGFGDYKEVKRAACVADNVLRALRANSAAASPFCTTYANIPTSTVLNPSPTGVDV